MTDNDTKLVLSEMDFKKEQEIHSLPRTCLAAADLVTCRTELQDLLELPPSSTKGLTGLCESVLGKLLCKLRLVRACSGCSASRPQELAAPVALPAGLRCPGRLRLPADPQQADAARRTGARPAGSPSCPTGPRSLNGSRTEGLCTLIKVGILNRAVEADAD